MKNNFIACILTIFVLIASSGIGSAADIVVHQGSSIQAAVNNATAGDNIIIQPGTYNGDLDLSDKTLTLKSQSAVITGTISADSSSNVAISGLTFKGENAGVRCQWSKCTVKNCKFMSCNSCIAADSMGSVTATNNQFIKCKGVIWAHDESGVTATNNQFIKCENALSASQESGIYAYGNKFIDCIEPILDISESSDSDFKNNEIINSSDKPVTVTNPVTVTKPTVKNTHETSTKHTTGTTSEGVPSSIQVTSNNNTVTCNFTNNTTSVKSITFRSENIIHEIKVIIEEFETKLNSIPCLPEGQVYKFFNISIKSDDLNCIRNETINFSVNNSWIQENNINQSSIALNEYNNTSEAWDKLQTNITGNDSQAVYCTTNLSNVSDNSSFAIAANESI